MKTFKPFVQEMDRLLQSIARNRHRDEPTIDAALDGQAGRELRRLVPGEDRYAIGAFFTSSTMAEKAAARLKPILSRGGRVCDPACGAGNLLLACTTLLQTACSPRGTIDRWGQLLVGRDTQQVFIEAAKKRLAIAALSRSRETISVLPPDQELFPRVTSGCGVTNGDYLRDCDAVIVNPPFNRVVAPQGCTWSSGSTNLSALFLLECLSHLQARTKVVAILPDVLRSGARYEKWRKEIERLAIVDDVEVLTQFDEHADVHVFMLVLRKRVNPALNIAGDWVSVDSETGCVGDLFNVSVGSVVDYRHAHCGGWRPFLVAKDLPTWETVREKTRSRRFSGTTVIAPFVVIRRTSRPEHTHRAVGTIIGGADKWAVENHLLVAKPIDGKYATCQSLLKILKSEATSEWLNNAIRCRPLTVSSVRGIPWHKKS